MTMLNNRKFSPFVDVDEMPAMRHLQDAVSRFMNEPGQRPWNPPVDILETTDELLIKMDAPEISMKDVEIRLENDTLTVKGERKFEQSQGRGYHRIERSYGTFARSFTLPSTVDTERVKADYKAGVITITLPKKEVAKPRTIRIDVSE
jgi:HSP20 family protein